MDIEEYERSRDQNEILGLNDMITENYQVGADDNAKSYYGTDSLQELPDRLRRLDVRGPDHPHMVGKAPVEGDVTVMGPESMNFAVPGMAQRGKMATQSPLADKNDLHAILRNFEKHDGEFRMTEVYEGHVEGMVFKDGAQGLGYYTDTPLYELWERQQH
jgi:hypothetical protein